MISNEAQQKKDKSEPHCTPPDSLPSIHAFSEPSHQMVPLLTLNYESTSYRLGQIEPAGASRSPQPHG